MHIINGFSLIENKPYYKYGNNGTKYYYDVNNEDQRKEAYMKAHVQGVSITVAKSKRGYKNPNLGLKKT
jgi:hypothetical protein